MIVSEGDGNLGINILFTAFRGTSSELLLEENGWQGLLLPNDKEKDAKLLVQELSSGIYNFVFSFGQKPNIKNKVYIETAARNAGEVLETGFDCGKLADAFRGEGMEVRISHNAGTSFCNHVYWNGLKYIRENGLKVKMVFVHIPMRKNISDFGKFCASIQSVVEVMANS